MAGKKVWAPLDVLAAADLNDYLMDQSVMVFDSVAARTAGIGTATEGMLTYLNDTNLYEGYNGSAWVSLNSLGGTVAGSQITGSITTATINSVNVQNTLTGSTATAYTLQDTDQGKVLQFTAGTAVVTVGTATAFTAGQRVDILADSVDFTVAAGTGVTFSGAGTAGTGISYTADQYSGLTVLCVGTDSYRIIGSITEV